MNASRTLAAADDVEQGFSPIDNEPPLRWQRRLHLAPDVGLGVARRAVLFALLAWLPMFAWAAATGHLWNDQTGEGLLQHYGLHVRFLVAIPLLILAEASLHKAARRIAPQLLDGGLVAPAIREPFGDVLRDMRHLRDRSLPWVFALGAALAWSVANQPEPDADAMAWAHATGGGIGFGGMWFAYVARPLFLALVVAWLWRLALVALLFARIGRLPLSLVPTHPDRVGGLGFLEKLPGSFALVTFALSAVLGSQWAHEIVYHGAPLESFKLPVLGFAVLWTVVLLLPLLVLVPTLAAAKGRALPAYSRLVGEQGRFVHRRWILGEPIDDVPLLDAPEIGPVADANAMYAAVKAMRPFPIGKSTLLGIVVPMALPLLATAALQVPFKELLVKLAKALV